MRNVVHSSYIMNPKTGSITGRRDVGQATALVTIVTVFICGILGLVVEAGHAYYLKQVTQAAARSADGRGHGEELLQKPAQHGTVVSNWDILKGKADQSSGS